MQSISRISSASKINEMYFFVFFPSIKSESCFCREQYTSGVVVVAVVLSLLSVQPLGLLTSVPREKDN